MLTAIKNYFKNDKGILFRGDTITFTSSNYLIVEATIIGIVEGYGYRTKIISIKDKKNGTYSDIADEWARNRRRESLKRNKTYILKSNDVIIETSANKIKSHLIELKKL